MHNSKFEIMKAKHMMIFLCTLMLVAGTACKKENTPEDKTVQKRHLTIKVQSDEGQSTKVAPQRMPNATITDQGTTLYAEWQAGDPVSCCNLSSLTTSGEQIITTTMNATSTGLKTDLAGDVECTGNDYMAIVYPTVDMTQSYKLGDAIHCKFALPLAGQDGLLPTLATHYHYVYGRAHVITATTTMAEAEMAPMKSLLTVCKFSFKNKNTNEPIPVKTLTISYGGAGSDAGTYPQSATVEVTNLTENHEAVAQKVEGSTQPLSIQCAAEQNEVYVVLLPEIASRIYNFTVTNSAGTYTGTAEALLKKGEYVVATNLKLEAN
jgi:hypothetical protein